MRPLILSFFALMLIFPSLPALAATGYVTDQIVLTLRSGPSEQAETLDHLKTDTRVEILTEEGRYARVRTEDGKEGFVQKQFLTDQTPKLLVINRQSKEIETLHARIKAATGSDAQVQQQLSDLQALNTQQEKELQTALASLEKLTHEYQQLLDASGNLLQTTQERDQLKEENIALTAEAVTLRDENTDLLTTGSIKWFLAGAGVLLFGWFMGKISRKKHRPF
jgi:SH3 domain protein